MSTSLLIGHAWSTSSVRLYQASAALNLKRRLAPYYAGTLAIFQLTSQHWHGQPGAQVRRIDDRPRDAEHAPNTSTHIFIDTSMLDNIRIMQI